jgi:LmbE family N-acetylglucosaminyl deacetylase
MSSELARTVRTFLRAANGLGARAAEAAWASSSAWAGTLRRPSVKRWTSSGHERVVVVAAHADDEAMGCVGTLIRHRRSGDSVRVILVTDGRLSRALGFDAPSISLRREEEAKRAAGRMGAQCDWLGLREGEWSDEEGRAAIRRSIEEANPTIIYAPSHIDDQPEHRRIAQLLSTLLLETKLRPEIRMYAVQVPLTPLLINLVHDVSDLVEPIAAVFSSYATQQESISRTFRLRRYAARFYGASTQVEGQIEGFSALSTELYASLHRRPRSKFRPLWIRAWRDPLSVIVGVRERLAWRRQINSADSR